VLKKAARCNDCGKELPEGSKVREYPLPSGGWKIYCLKHPKGENRQEMGSPPPASNPKPSGSPKPKGDWREVLEAIQRVEAKLDVLITLLKRKDDDEDDDDDIVFLQTPA